MISGGQKEPENAMARPHRLRAGADDGDRLRFAEHLADQSVVGIAEYFRPTRHRLIPNRCGIILPFLYRIDFSGIRLADGA
jgi:hypothetical protein